MLYEVITISKAILYQKYYFKLFCFLNCLIFYLKLLLYKQSSMYKAVIRPLLFLFDPEKIHHFTFALIRLLCKIPGISSMLRNAYCVEDKRLEKTLFGLTFKNPVGLAAGFVITSYSIHYTKLYEPLAM